jgi:xanthine/CO dehydrogenase XdhC/CoxF family maturation factor
MLIAGDRGVGMISGGCLENDVIAYTQRLNSAEPIVVTYDTSVETDLLWGFGIGCNGTVQVLIERLEPEQACDPIAFMQHCDRTRQTGVMVTVFAVETGEAGVAIGSRLLMTAGRVTTDMTSPELIADLTRAAERAVAQAQSRVERFVWESGWVEALIEVIQPPLALLVIGSGQDAVPVAELAKHLGWRVTIVDCRANETTQERFTGVDQIILTRREMLPQAITLDASTAAVIMTHNYLDDRAALQLLLPSPAGYVGMLGSRDRCDRLLREVLAENIQPTQAQLDRCYAPVGLDLGADTPATIALAIVAEIQRGVTQRSGRSLRERRRLLDSTIAPASAPPSD